MKKYILPIVLILGIFSILFIVSALESSGDGTYTVKKGDIITLDNGWKVEITSVGDSAYSQMVNFIYYDTEGNSYSGSVKKIEGRKKFGTLTRLRIEMEILETFGAELSRAGVSWVEREKAKINVVSIDETLPTTVTGGDEEIEEVNKVLTFKDGKKITLNTGEETILGNGYKIKLERFDQRWGSPYFSIYNSQGEKIDSDIGIGKGAGASIGSYVQVDDYTTTSADVTIIEGSKLTFGTGWNLFSISVEDGDGYGTVLESTCNKAVLWVWNNDIKDYEKVGVLDEGTKIPAGKGIWAKTQTKRDTISDIDCEVLVSGKKSVSTQSIQLKSGWNLIGAPITAYGEREEFEDGSNFNMLTFNDVLGNCRLEKGPWQFLGTKYTSNFYQNAGEVAEEHKFSQPFENKLMINRAYFIKVIDDCTLVDK